ncbi:MAG: NADH-quinone oxidoreductase subunit A [Holosporales bacterium]|jgi:NADH:ubiquinone oxidoreductase subunit 3 (subunit A)|nr:NADH-quinone oxidoreductase subunit A [Holosporales bacterium]
MPSIEELSVSSAVIILAGLLSVCALLVSRISELLPGRHSSRASSAYECGFDGEHDTDFLYLCEYDGIVSLFVIIEIATLWLVACCSLSIVYSSTSGRLSVKILALILIALLRITVNITRW